MPRRPPLRASLFASHSLTRVTNNGGSGGYFEGEVTGPAGEGSWLFALADLYSAVDSGVMLSIADGGALYLGRLDLSSLDVATVEGDSDTALTTIEWVEVDIADYGAAITDHWHIYAFGSHWIAYAVNDGSGSTETDLWLIRIDPADVIAAIAAGSSSVSTSDVVLAYTTKDATDVASEYANYAAAGGAALVSNTSGGYSTNDHFIVEVPGGIAVAIWHPGGEADLRVMTVDSSALTLSADVSFAGATAGPDTTATTGSAVASYAGTWLVLVPDSTYPTTSSNYVNLFETDAAFDNARTALVGYLDDASYNLQMASFIQLANDDLVVAYKRVPISGTYDDGSAVLTDWGDLLLEVYDGALTTAAVSEVLLTASSDASGSANQMGNRPHVSRWRRWLVTCWDIADGDESEADPLLQVTNYRSYLRIDLIEGVP